MVVGAFPVVKLGVLLMKQISKPIANFAKERAKNSPFFRTYICMPPAQFYNWCEVKTKMWIMNLGKPIHIPTLNETMAIELGANLLGEGIIFVIASALLILEYQRQSLKETAKEEARVEQVETMNRTIKELAFMVEKQDTQLREVLRLIGDLDSRVVKKPSWPMGGKNPAETPVILKENSINSAISRDVVDELAESLPVEQDDSAKTKTKTGQASLLQDSLNYLENEVWCDSNHGKYKPGIIMKALYYLEKDIFTSK